MTTPQRPPTPYERLVEAYNALVDERNQMLTSTYRYITPEMAQDPGDVGPSVSLHRPDPLPHWTEEES